MKMQELERRTGVTRQMVQFYLANGLLPQPARPKPNVADYGEEHVRAIEVIRRLQTEGRLRIQEIKQALNGAQVPVGSDVGVLPHLDELFAIRQGVDSQLVALSSLQARSEHARADAEILQRIGAIEFIERGGEVHLSRMDAQIVDYWAEMRAVGFTDDDGIGPDVVSMYVRAATELADAEIDIFVSRVRSDRPVEKKAAMADAASRLMLNIFAVLRKKAEVAAFRRIAGGDSRAPALPARGPALAEARRSPRRLRRA